MTTPATPRPWDTAPADSIWRISGTYGPSPHTFTDCLAIVLPGFVTGYDSPVFAMLPPLNDLVEPEWISAARIVVERPWGEQ